MPRWALPAAEADDQSSSSEEEEVANGQAEDTEEETDDEALDEQPGPSSTENGNSAPAVKQKIKMTFKKTGEVCHVCPFSGSLTLTHGRKSFVADLSDRVPVMCLTLPIGHYTS